MKINLSINKAEREQLKLQVMSPTLQSDLIKLQHKIEEACVRAETRHDNVRLKTLAPVTWYIADVAFIASNPVHRCVAFHQINGMLELIGSYNIDDMPVRRRITDLAYLPTPRITRNG